MSKQQTLAGNTEIGKVRIAFRFAWTGELDDRYKDVLRGAAIREARRQLSQGFYAGKLSIDVGGRKIDGDWGSQLHLSPE